MTLTAELRGLRQELRQSVAGTITFWPKVQSTGNALASPTSGHCQFTVYDLGGAIIQGPSNVTPTTVGAISRIDCPVSAIATLGEDYACKITWRVSGGSVEYVDVVPFRVVLYPWATPSVSLNTFLEDYPESGEILRRQGIKAGYGSTGTVAEETQAATLGYRALVELDRWVRGVSAPSGAVPRSGAWSPGELGLPSAMRARLHLVRNREALGLIERKIALKLLFRAEGGSTEGTDENSLLFRSYATEAESEWRALTIQYDSSETSTVPDTQIESAGAIKMMRRASW